MNYEIWKQHTFSTGGHAGEDYIKFQRQMRSDLKKMLEKKGIRLYAFHKSHYEFSAIAEKDGKFAYIAISDVRCFRNEWFNRVLYRTMEHDSDWTGGQNHYCRWTNLSNCIEKILISQVA